MICRACKFAEACEPAHHAALTALRARYGITPTPHVAKKEKVQKTTVDPTASVMPKKAMELVERLDRGQFDVTGSLKRGENPFVKGMNFMRVACHLLLRAPEPFNREFLAAAFVKSLGWKQNTADAHARMAIHALTHVGAVDNRDGRISIRRG